MSHRAPAIVTTAHVQRAYAQLHKADWPPLDVMESIANKMAIVRARASALANGHTLPAEPAAAQSPVYSARAAGHTEHRRRDDLAGAIDLKSRAAGERDDE